ncbi:substrate-binding periplasmic protein [Propionivibrio dicarboxylicus]|uniref:Polar amino acid transport system substrate-binding protein n=1 Tax=Propionivibrio dicarboxylicus TaxID=83767 RepID=A0A1G8EW11_9RHOO|nr:transporter substrate-binding domain-containing protein [Propionivibrio dicarboxylicus]SDH73997.1 polar amino acid transport system substrate-binding protein [Propionivibrio dicarboxylicus]
MKVSRKIKNLRILTILSCLGALFISGIAAAGPVDCGSSPIRVGQFKLGYRYYIENGQEKGMNKDIMEEIKKRTGCLFITQEMPFARLWADLSSGEIDMTLSGIRSPERDKTLWCIPSITAKNFVVIGPQAQASVKNAADFIANEKLQFGMVRGYTHGKELDAKLDRLKQDGRVEESGNVDVLFEKLKHGRIDGFYSFPFVYRKNISELSMEKDVTIQDWAPKDPGIVGCMMLTKQRFSEDEAKRWNALVQQMRADGTLKRIFVRYVSPSEADKMLNF